MLAYYVQWHMLDVWCPLLFSDEDHLAKKTGAPAARDPVAPATCSPAALVKVHTHTLDDGSEAHSFRTLMKSLGTIMRNTCCITTADDPATFEVYTTPTTNQQRALDLLKQVKM